MLSSRNEHKKTPENRDISAEEPLKGLARPKQGIFEGSTGQRGRKHHHGQLLKR
jgi:hypothetical protein